jgi:hypothetical protein
MARMARPEPADLLGTTYAAVVDVLRSVDDDASWRPTGCRGWAVRDLTYHCVSDAQRALVALHSPTDEEPDLDAVGYWADWGSDPAGDANGRRHTRVLGSMFGVWQQLRDLHAETAVAVVHAARGADPDQRVRTQGHVLRVADLLSTLAVEATIHHLDLVADLSGRPGPSAAGLAEVRRVLDALLGLESTPDWPDERYVLVATGRTAPSAAERDVLGTAADRLPVFT